MNKYQLAKRDDHDCSFWKEENDTSSAVFSNEPYGIICFWTMCIYNFNQTKK